MKAVEGFEWDGQKAKCIREEHQHLVRAQEEGEAFPSPDGARTPSLPPLPASPLKAESCSGCKAMSAELERFKRNEQAQISSLVMREQVEREFSRYTHARASTPLSWHQGAGGACERARARSLSPKMLARLRHDKSGIISLTPGIR